MPTRQTSIRLPPDEWEQARTTAALLNFPDRSALVRALLRHAAGDAGVQAALRASHETGRLPSLPAGTATPAKPGKVAGSSPVYGADGWPMALRDELGVADD